MLLESPLWRRPAPRARGRGCRTSARRVRLQRVALHLGVDRNRRDMRTRPSRDSLEVRAAAIGILVRNLEPALPVLGGDRGVGDAEAGAAARSARGRHASGAAPRSCGSASEGMSRLLHRVRTNGPLAAPRSITVPISRPRESTRLQGGVVGQRRALRLDAVVASEEIARGRGSRRFGLGSVGCSISLPPELLVDCGTLAVPLHISIGPCGGPLA